MTPHANGAPVSGPQSPEVDPGILPGTGLGVEVVLGFVVPGQPMGKALKVARIGGPGGFAKIVPTGPSQSWMDTVMWAARMALRGRSPELGPMGVEVVAVLRRPQSLCRRKDPDGEIPAPVKPDGDNVVKGLFDGMTRAGVWRDDRQVVDLRVRKVYHGKDGSPETRVRIRRVE
jgi:Holliday junction resolvase RusA-like endonuclease